MDETLIRFRGELRRSAERRIQQRRRRVRVVVALSALGALALTGGAIAANHLFDSLGTPAPANVIRDFDSFTPQLGFHPQGSRAVLYAKDDETGVGLYVAPNAEGTSCLTFTAPWKTSPDQEVGATCMSQANAAQPILAGWLGVHAPKDGLFIAVVGGRVTTPDAVSVRFASANGDDDVRSLGIGGYFVVALSGAAAGITAHGCDNDWIATFTALDAHGHELSSATIRLAHALRGACGMAVGLHAPGAG